MIDPKELRIGNLVYYKYLRSAPDEWVYGKAVISGIHENGFQFKKITGNHSLVVDLKDFDPIPITPEWLERLGFEKINHISEGVIYKKEWLRLNDKCMVIDWRSGGIDCRLIKSIHQLQNLYFALTGTELQIKQP